jgi:hypothetical protein
MAKKLTLLNNIYLFSFYWASTSSRLITVTRVFSLPPLTTGEFVDTLFCLTTDKVVRCSTLYLYSTYVLWCMCTASTNKLPLVVVITTLVVVCFELLILILLRGGGGIHVLHTLVVITSSSVSSSINSPTCCWKESRQNFHLVCSS